MLNLKNILRTRGSIEKEKLSLEVDALRKINTDLTKRAYAMSASNRNLNDWAQFVNTTNYDIRTGGIALLSRARDMVKNDPYARKYVNIQKKNIVGPDGFVLRVKSGDYVKDKDDQYKFVLDKYANQVLQRMMTEWGKKQYCTITGDISFRELCELGITTTYSDGEILFIKIRGRNVNKFGFTLQPVEAEYLDYSYNVVLNNGNTILMGIEFDKQSKPVAYHFTVTNPYTEINNAGYRSNQNRIRIPAENVIHLFKRETTGQKRGVTQFAPMAIRLRMLNGFEEASLVNARSAACTTGIIQERPNGNMNPNFDGHNKDANGNVVETISPNEIIRVPDGHEWVTYDPKFPSDQHGPFSQQVLKAIASGGDVSYHTLASDYLGVSWTSSRTALQDERDGHKSSQAWFIEHFLDDVYASLLEMAILSGAVNLPIEKFEKFNQPYWIGRRWDWVDPEAEVNAAIKARMNLMKPLEDIVAERGYDLEELLDQIKEEDKMLKERGLTMGGLSITALKPPEQPAQNNGNGNGNGRAALKDYQPSIS